MDWQNNINDSYSWVERWLHLWAQWMRRPDLALGAPERSSGFIGGGYGGYREPAAEWEAEGEHRAVVIIDAALAGMHVAEVAAVNHVHLGAKWVLPGSAWAFYVDARQKLGMKLRASDFGPHLTRVGVRNTLIAP